MVGGVLYCTVPLYLAREAEAVLVDTAAGVTRATMSTTVHTTTATLRPILMLALLFWDRPLLLRATMERMRAGRERVRQMTDPPHVMRVKRENTRAHMATPAWFSSGGDTRVVVAVTGCAATTTVVLASCGW